MADCFYRRYSCHPVPWGISEPVRPLGKSFTRIYNTPTRNSHPNLVAKDSTNSVRVRVEVEVRFRDLGASF